LGAKKAAEFSYALVLQDSVFSECLFKNILLLRLLAHCGMRRLGGSEKV